MNINLNLTTEVESDQNEQPRRPPEQDRNQNQAQDQNDENPDLSNMFDIQMDRDVLPDRPFSNLKYPKIDHYEVELLNKQV